jgi:integrase
MATEPIHHVGNGRWELRYRDPSGRPRRMRFATKREARDFSSDLRVRSQLGTWTSPETGRLTLERWVNEWWATVVHLRPATKVRYERDVRLHVLPRFGVTQLARISPRDVRAWVAEMTAAGNRASAVRLRFSVLRKILADAAATEMIPRNPCNSVRPPADSRSDVVILGPAEVRDLADAVNPWSRSWIWFAAHSGLRWSEMLGARRRDLDLLRRTVSVRQQIIEVNGRFLGFGEPKTAAGKRTVDLPAFLCAMIEEQLAERAQPGPDGLVFVNTRGNPPHTSSFASQTWLKARRAIGRPDLRWHDLRHTAVALAIAQGAHPKAIQERMGHASITITLDPYGHLFPALGRQVAEGLDRVCRESIAAPRPPCPVALTAKPSTSNQATVRTTLAGPDGGPFQRQMTWDGQPASLGR